jgi:hypothetical protein
MEEEELQASVSKKAMDDSKSDLANDITRSSPDEPKAQDFTTEHDQGNSSTGCAGCLDTSMAAVDLESIGSPCTVSRSGKVILSSEESESADEEVSFTMFRQTKLRQDVIIDEPSGTDVKAIHKGQKDSDE